jgi:hypothetical protein
MVEDKVGGGRQEMRDERERERRSLSSFQSHTLSNSATSSASCLSLDDKKVKSK